MTRSTFELCLKMGYQNSVVK